MTLALLLGAAATGIAERGRAAVGSRTMLDALVPASEAAEHSAAAGEAIERSPARAADAADEGALSVVEPAFLRRALDGLAGVDRADLAAAAVLRALQRLVTSAEVLPGHQRALLETGLSWAAEEQI
jgi:dihydroxyacetone kinase-like protein